MTLNLTIDDIKPGKLLSVKIAVYFARDVLYIFEEKYPEDLRPRLAIEAAEKYLDGSATAYAAVSAANAAYAVAAYAANAAVYAVEKNRDNYIHQKLLELLPVIFHHKMEHREPFGNIENIWKYLTEEQKEEAIYFLDVLK